MILSAERVYFIASLYFIYKYWTERQRKLHFARLIEEKRRAREAAWASFQRKYQTLLASVSEEEKFAIVRMTATELLRAMSEGRLTSVRILVAFIKRARECGEILSSNADEPFESAVEAAKHADEVREKARKDGSTATLPPLLGLPISIKDQLDQQGCDSTCGLARLLFKPAPHDGMIVRLLREAGAVPFVRSNISQVMMLPESNCAVWGVAKNPWNKSRTPGGSSGGEAALIAAGGSPLGVGTDIGGSVRIPAAFCGIYSFKPTQMRMTTQGFTQFKRKGMQEGIEVIRSTVGPMGRCVSDLLLLMKVWLSDKTFAADATVPPMPFDNAAYNSSAKIRFGFYVDDDFFMPAAPCRRAVMEVVEQLRAKGHDVVPFTGRPSTLDATRLFFGVLSAEGGFRNIVECLQGEDLHPTYRLLYYLANVPSWLRSSLVALLRLIGQTRGAALLEVGGAKSAYEFQELTHALLQFNRSYYEAMQRQKIDVIICPGFALPALLHGTSSDLNPTAVSTFLYNTTRMPAGSLPVTSVRAEECGGYEDPRYSKYDALSVKAALTMKGAEGLPINVQVVGLPYRDETVLRAMKIIEDLNLKDRPVIPVVNI